MMSLWLFLLALVPPIFYAISNLFDKVVSHGDYEDNDSLAIVAMGSVFDLFLAIPIGVVCVLTTGILFPGADTFWPLFLNGSIFILASWLFLQSIKVEDSSKVTAIFQVIPAFGIFFGFYGLNENLGWVLILGIVFLMIGGFVLSFSKGKISIKVLVMMLFACSLYAVNDFVIAKYGREVIVASGNVASVTEALPAIMADLAGKVFFGMIPLISRKVRKSFTLGFKTKFKLVAASSVTYTFGDVSFDIAKILAPLAVVQALCCFQPLFVLVGAIGLSIFCKGFPKEDISTWSLVQKLFGISLMVVGGILLSI
jgi:drug/metabolite transporter (DMT)-like permease